MPTPTIYDFFRKLKAVDINDTEIGTVEADSTTDTLTIKAGDNISLVVDAATDSITVQGDSTDLFVPIGSTTIRHQQGLDQYDVNLVGGHGVNVVRKSANELEIQHVDGDTNIVWVSRTQGDDTHDGINAPVRTIKRAAEIASSIAYTPKVAPTASQSGAENLLNRNIEFIKAEVIAYIAATYPSLTYNSAKCARDTALLVDGAVYDMLFTGNSKSRLYAEFYFEQASAEVVNNQLVETVAANTFLKALLADILTNTPVTPLQLGVSQTIDAGITVVPSDVTKIQDGIQITIDTLTAGNTNSLPALVKPAFTITPTTIKIASGDYTEQNPIIVPDGVSLVGDSLRTVIIRPANANQNMFHLRNGSYVTQITFRDQLNVNGEPDFTWNFTFAFDDIYDVRLNRGDYKYLSATKPVVTASPYIFNCSLISFLGGSGVDVNGDLVESPNIPAIDAEIELATDTRPGLPVQGKSMIGAAYTMLTFGGTGWLIRNQAYSQLVSCFQIFAKNGVYAQNGGYVSITNSATNFGLFALRAIGQMPIAFDYDKPIIASNGIFEGAQTFKVVGSQRRVQEQFIIRVRNALDVDITENHKQIGTELTFDSNTNVNGNLINIVGHGFNGGEKVVYRSNGNNDIIGLLDRNEYHLFKANNDEIGLYEDDRSLYRAIPTPTTVSQTHIIKVPDEEFFVNEVIDSHNQYQELVLSPGTYSFTPGIAITGDDGGIPVAAIVHTYDPGTRTLIVSIEKVQLGETAVRNNFSLTATISADHAGTPATNISITGIEDLTTLYTTEFTIGSTYSSSEFQNISAVVGLTMNLHRPTIVNSSAHTWEYAGSGIDYNALPENGGQTYAPYQQVRNQEGRVYTSGTNELGDFLVGDFITAENKTGNIQFKNKVTITELDSLSLTLSDVTINEISADTGLGDNDLNGPLHSRLVTQLSVRSFIDNRLGDFIDKSVSTNAVPSAIAQLNSAGQLNPELIPATRSFTSFVLSEFEGRLRVSLDIPAGDAQSGDIVVENYLDTILTLNGSATVVKGETITQAVSGATGEVKISVTGTTLTLVNTTGTFDTTNTLSGSVSGALAVIPNVVDADNERQDSYFLSIDNESMFLILDPATYSFTIGNTINGAVSSGQGEITAFTEGVVSVLNNPGLDSGSGYNTDGTYTNVALTGGSGTGVIADIVVSAGGVSSVDVKRGGSGYIAGESLSAADGDIGGRTGGGAFSIAITEVQQRLYIDLTGPKIKFIASGANPDFIADNNATTVSVNQTYTNTYAFDAATDVAMTPNQITLVGHGLTNGDPVKYSSGVNLPIGNVANNSVYRVKVIDVDTIELYDDYDLTTQRVFTQSSTGTHTLTINSVQTVGSTFYQPAHGLTTGDAIQYNTATPPSGIVNAAYYFVGSVTTNSFTLHASRENALISINGITFANKAVISTGTGTASLLIHNVQVTSQVNTSSTNLDNWSVLSSGNIDASNIISGVIDTSRLGTGNANSDAALFGDSSYKLVTKTLSNTTVGDPITLAGTFATDAGVDRYYGNIDIRVENAGADTVITADTGQAYYSKGVAKFLKEHFTNSTAGEVGIKASTQGGTVDAATLGGVGRSHYENPENMSRAVPITLGGTNLTGYAQGDLLYSGGTLNTDLQSLSKLAIGTAGQVLKVNTGATAPEWSSSLTLDDLYVGNIRIAVTSDNEIDTTTGNLTIDSAGGTTTIDDDLIVSGNLTVSGTTTTVNTETINLADNIININSNLAVDTAPTQDGGISINRGNAAAKTLLWNETTDKWTVGSETFVAGTFEGNLSWTNVTNKPDPVVTVTLTGDVTGSASATLTDLASGTISVATTVAANSVALGTDTTGNYMVNVTAGTGISVSHTQAEGSTATITNSDLGSSQSIFKNIAVSGQTTVVADSNNDTLTFAAGGGISITTNATTDTVTIDHSDTSTQASVNNSGNTFIQDVTLDTYGHVTGLTSATVSIGDATITLAAGNGLTTGGDFTTNQSTNETITFNVGAGDGIVVAADTVSHADTSTQASVNNSNGNVIQDVTVDGFGHVTGLGSVNLDNRYSPYQKSATISNRPVGWYTIATNSGSRASAKFTLIDTASGAHQSTVFYATHHFGNDNNINVLMNGYYSGSPFRYIRIKEGSTYDGAVLQVYIDQITSTAFAVVEENWQSSGWVVKDWIADATDPGGLGSAGYAALTTIAETIDLDSTAKGGAIFGSDILVSGNILTDANNNGTLGTSSTRWNTMYATTFDGVATSAKYADLAEKYLADAEYPVGTVIAVGGSAEVTAADEITAHSVLGVVSENPAYMMNSELEGGTYIALKGRVPVRVTGTVRKGDRIAPSDVPGLAKTDNRKSSWSFAIALTDAVDGMVEAVIL